VQRAVTLQGLSPTVTSTVPRTITVSTKTTTGTQLSGGSSARGLKSKHGFWKIMGKVISVWVAFAAASGGKISLTSELDVDADDMLKP